MTDAGKGSKPRPFSVSLDEFAERWDSIKGFSKKNPFSKGKRAIEEHERIVPEKKTLPMDKQQ